jgi:hypothetical protein
MYEHKSIIKVETYTNVQSNKKTFEIFTLSKLSVQVQFNKKEDSNSGRYGPKMEWHLGSCKLKLPRTQKHYQYFRL